MTLPLPNRFVLLVFCDLIYLNCQFFLKYFYYVFTKYGTQRTAQTWPKKKKISWYIFCPAFSPSISCSKTRQFPDDNQNTAYKHSKATRFLLDSEHLRQSDKDRLSWSGETTARRMTAWAQMLQEGVPDLSENLIFGVKHACEVFGGKKKKIREQLWLFFLLLGQHLWSRRAGVSF